jgi:hypothetical protein
MKNPFESPQEDQNAIPAETMRRWKVMQSHVGDKTDLSRLQPVVQRLVGERVERDWHRWSRTSGQVFPEQFRDSSGRDCVRYAGDIKAAFAPWVQEPLKVRLSETSNFQGRTYIAGKEPPDVRRAMLLAKNGFSE